MPELIITNGNSTEDSMREAGFTEDILCWKDVLHDGPIPGNASWDELTAIRCKYLSEHFGETDEHVAHDFMERDRILNTLNDYTRVALWFEHDLYDQLQLAQILDFISRADRIPHLYLLQSDDYLGVTPPPKFPELRQGERRITDADLTDGTRFWQIFTGNDPRALHTFLSYQGPLRYLPSITRRLLQTFPYLGNGLTLTERYALKHLREHQKSVASLFGDYWHEEEIKYLGDWSFILYLEELAVCRNPLLDGYSIHFRDEMKDRKRVYQQKVSLTPVGRDVLRGEKHHIALNGIDRWIGGTHLTPDNLFCFDPDSERLVKVEEL